MQLSGGAAAIQTRLHATEIADKATFNFGTARWHYEKWSAELRRPGHAGFRRGFGHAIADTARDASHAHGYCMQRHLRNLAAPYSKTKKHDSQRLSCKLLR